MARESVLIVEDNPQNRKLASFILENAGYRVHAAVDAEQAQELLHEIQPLLILMDLQLPGMDGLAFTRILKADPSRRHIAILAFTAYAMKSDEDKALAAGCDGYVSKPVNRAALLDAVAHHVARAAANVGNEATAPSQ
jgi:CheY-like chemotaxis protein